MGMGLEGAYGADALSNNLRERVLEQLRQRQQEFQNSLALRGADRADRQLSQQDELTRLKLKELEQNQAATQYGKDFTQGEKASEAIPGGTVFPTVDRMAPPSSAPLMGRLQMVGALAPFSGSLGSTTDTPANASTGTPPTGRLVALPEGQVKLPTANQQNVLADNARADRARSDAESLARQNEPLQEVIGANGKPTLVRRSAAAGMTPFVKPSAEPTVVIQGPTGAEIVNRNTGTSRPVIAQGGGQLGPAPTSAERTKEADLSRAHDGLDQLDAAITSAKDLIGPGEGRISSLEQSIGNPDPRISALGTKLLMAKMRADASIGGTRAAASPQLLARWDNLLAQKLTPENLHSTVQAMREMLGPRKRAASAGTSTMSADELLKKYGGGQ